MNVLLSIKPEYADKIFDGTKKYEFRRCIYKSQEVKKIIVYSSSPVKKVIGEFEVSRILSDEPKKLWNVTKKYAGIAYDLFIDYFVGKDVGHAIKIKKVNRYKEPMELSEFSDLSRPPQSFAYIPA